MKETNGYFWCFDFVMILSMKMGAVGFEPTYSEEEGFTVLKYRVKELKADYTKSKLSITYISIK